jgi:hypothetical protein
MCTVLLLPGGYPIAVNKYIISYHIIVCSYVSFPLSITQITQQHVFYQSYLTTTSVYSVFQIFKKKMIASVSWNKTSCLISRLFFKDTISKVHPRTGHEGPEEE